MIPRPIYRKRDETGFISFVDNLDKKRKRVYNEENDIVNDASKKKVLLNIAETESRTKTMKMEVYKS